MFSAISRWPLGIKWFFRPIYFIFVPFADKPKTQEENDEVDENLDTNDNIENNDKAEEEENQEIKTPKIGEFWRVGGTRQDIVVIETVELDTLGVKFFKQSSRGTENYSKDTQPFFICSEDLDKRLTPPKVKGKGSRTFYSFENSDDQYWWWRKYGNGLKYFFVKKNLKYVYLKYKAKNEIKVENS